MRGSREISLVPSLHRASTDALIQCDVSQLESPVAQNEVIDGVNDPTTLQSLSPKEVVG